MEIVLLAIGKTQMNFIKEGIDFYLKRIKHYVNFRIVEVSQKKYSKKTTPEQMQKAEQIALEKYLTDKSNVFLLDENGKEFTSIEFAEFINNKLITYKNLTFVIGGSYGFSQEMKKRYKKISLSKMTFQHDLVRLIFVEQIYRAFTIINNEIYHH